MHPDDDPASDEREWTTPSALTPSRVTPEAADRRELLMAEVALVATADALSPAVRAARIVELANVLDAIGASA